MCETMDRSNSHDSSSSDGSGSLNTSMDKEATQAVQVALNVRPLITQERIQGCKDCILVVPREPQVCLVTTSSFSVDVKCTDLFHFSLYICVSFLMVRQTCPCNEF